MIADLAYRPAEPMDGRGHLLDLYLPADPRGDRPLVLWTGGSGWMRDNGKDSAGPIAGIFTARGYAVAGVSIRSSGQGVFPAQLRDIRAAIRWLRGHARQYRLDPERFTVMGDSSGGWTAAMAALTGDDDPAAGGPAPSSRVQAAVAFYPPTDFLRMDEQMLPGARRKFNRDLGITDCHNDPRSPESRLLGGAIRSRPEAAGTANPARYAARSAPPMLLLHGQADALVPHGQSVLLYEALRDAGATVTFYSIPGAGHDWRAVLDPTNHDDQRVYQARSGSERVTTGRPGPGWDAVDRFIREAMEVRRDNTAGRKVPRP
ncbi:alpha/beta hydrolase [Plantactinospora sp. S1510]|uniref:Alpha/beta hydrolase n=1 Tax=Plantactinospora alkalitolerans TaxID=2789879 RepID=A0ABS0H997_9ACTN|nr:alpha/beta hydrolase [Plantactinospora alkalitolerans]MBF9135051.1 alpha/beta hydrolase [Plantactinospora alkalitolerans]